MKKLPIVLLTLILAGIGEPVMASDLMVGVNAEVAALASNAEMVANALDERVRITEISPEDGRLKLELGRVGDELVPRRVLLVYYDYEKGVTEAEADVQAQELGEKSYVKWGKLAYKEQSDEWGKDQELTVETDLQLTEVNKPDILYYAVQFGKREASANGSVRWTDMEWTRGKIDYRNCVHAQNYRVGQVCERVIIDDEKIDYWAGGVKPEGGVVTTWDIEWWTVQQQRLARMDNDILDISMGIRYGTEVEKAKMEEKGQEYLRELRRMKKLFAVMADPQSLVAWRDSVEKRLLDLGLTIEDEDDEAGDETEDLREDWGDNDDDNRGDETDKIGGNLGNSGDKQAVTVVETGKITLAVETGNRGGVASRVLALSGVMSGNMIGTEDQTEDMTDYTNDANGTVLTDEVQKLKTEDDVQVPATGGKKWNVMEFWWVLIPVIGVLVMLILWLKRAFGRDEY